MQIRPPQPCRYFVGVLIADGIDIASVAARLAERWGAIDLTSEVFSFAHTEYYRAEMGDNIRRVFFGFDELMMPDGLAQRKVATNEMEAAFADSFAGDLTRPVNLDPGYLTPATVILASAKQFSHRIYIGKGIYAEVTLRYRHKQFHCFDWTFPDYGAGRYWPFFFALRDQLMDSLRTP